MKIKKKRTVIGVINLCLVLLPVFTCKSTEIREPDSGWYMGSANFVHGVFQEDEVVYAYPDKKQPKLDFTVRLIKAAPVLGDFINSKLYRGLSCEDFASKSFNEIREMYLSTVQELIQTETKPETSPSLNWTWSRYDGGTVFGSIVVLREYGEYYEGGAHPRHEKNYYVFDLEKESQIFLKDLIMPNAQDDLTLLVKKEISNTYTKTNQKSKDGAAAPENSENSESPALMDLGFFSNDVELPVENFYLSKEGLVFCWGEYEIAPYYFGIIELVLPEEQIKTFLSKEGRRVFDIIGRS